MNAIISVLFLYGPAVATIVAIPLSRTDKARTIWLGVFTIWLIGFIALVGMVSWLFRDGMGPDSVTSHGVTAMRRFAEGFWPEGAIASVAAIMAAAGNRFARNRNRNRTDSADKSTERYADPRRISEVQRLRSPLFEDKK